MLLDQRLPEREEIGLAVCCDWHYGARTADTRAIRKWVSMIKENKWFAVLLGDLTENAILGSVGSVYEQESPPMQQIRDVVDILSPIKDYIIGGVSGNHGARSVRAVGIDPDELISTELGVPHFGYTMSGRIQVGNAHWIVVAHHGAGGGILKGSKLNMAYKLVNIYPMADLYLVGHAHADVAGSDRVMEVSLHGARPVERWRVRRVSGCGSLLDYRHSYAEQKMFPPAVKAQVVHFMGSRMNTKHGDSPDKWLKPYRREVHWF